MTDREYIRQLRRPTEIDPLRILVSACLTGIKCGVDGNNYGDYPSVLQLLKYSNVKITTFCPENHSFGTPRETCDIYGGSGVDVLDGKAKVLTSTGVDWTAGMIKAAEKMLEVAKSSNIEIAIMMDISAACGSQVIYDGNRYAENKKYQIGMGVCAALLTRHGFKVISQRDFATLEILYSRIDHQHVINELALDHDQGEWYRGYFGANKKI